MLPFGFRLLEGIKLLGAGEATGGVWTGVTRAFGATLADGLLILFLLILPFSEIFQCLKMKLKKLKFDQWVGFGVFKIIFGESLANYFPFLLFGESSNELFSIARKWKGDNLSLTFLEKKIQNLLSKILVIFRLFYRDFLSVWPAEIFSFKMVQMSFVLFIYEIYFDNSLYLVIGLFIFLKLKTSSNFVVNILHSVEQ